MTHTKVDSILPVYLLLGFFSHVYTRLNLDMFKMSKLLACDHVATTKNRNVIHTPTHIYIHNTKFLCNQHNHCQPCVLSKRKIVEHQARMRSATTKIIYRFVRQWLELKVAL